MWTRTNDIHDRAHEEDGQPQDAIVCKKVVFFLKFQNQVIIVKTAGRIKIDYNVHYI